LSADGGLTWTDIISHSDTSAARVSVPGYAGIRGNADTQGWNSGMPGDNFRAGLLSGLA
jgi:hypothetical protein